MCCEGKGNLQNLQHRRERKVQRIASPDEIFPPCSSSIVNVSQLDISVLPMMRVSSAPPSHAAGFKTEPEALPAFRLV